MATSVEALGEQLGSLFGQIDKGQQQISANQQVNQQSLHEQTQRVMSEVDDQIKKLIETVANQHQGTTETLNKLAEQTSRQIQDMQNGADKMRVAAERFEHAGDRVSEAKPPHRRCSEQSTISRFIAFTCHQRTHVCGGGLP